MRLSQLQDEVIDHAHRATVDPATFADRMAHDLDDVHAAIADLVDQGLMAADGDTFRLTDQGEAVHQAQEKAHRDAVLRSTGSWQRR